MGSEVLVTVVGPARRGDVCLDDSVPVSTLVADLVRHYGGPASGSELVVGDDRGAALDPDTSLSQAGVTHGARLTLRSRPAGGRTPATRRAAAPTAVTTPPVVAAAPAAVTSAPTAVTTPTGDTGSWVAPSAGSPGPIDRTRQVLPGRVGPAHRLVTSVAAAASRGGRTRPSGAVPGGVAPSPADLTLFDAPGAGARWRRAWAETDYVHRLDRAITGPQLARCATVAVVSPKGGVGKTTITALLGTLIAHLRRDLVVAIDANPDYGSLGRVLCPTHTIYVDELAGYLETAVPPAPSLADLNARLGVGPHGLRVLPSPTDPVRMGRIGFDTYGAVIARMTDYAGLLLLDCGTGLHEPAARAALAAADQVIVVSDADPASASLVAEATRRIPVPAPLTLVVNKMPARGCRLDLDRLAEMLPDVEHLVVVPAEPKAASALGLGAFSWEGVPASWQRAVRELAGVLIAGWASVGLERV